jgi:hypothetical protein
MENYTEKVVDANRNVYYYNDKKSFHRLDGPAVVWFDSSKEWWYNGKRHRDDGHAIEYANGDKHWFISGKLHRLDGPAIVREDGVVVWAICGEEYRKLEHNRLALFFMLEPQRFVLKSTEDD